MKTRNLKWADFGYNLDTREFVISKVTENDKGGARDEVRLSRAEAGSLSRFIFSMFQFHPKRKK